MTTPRTRAARLSRAAAANPSKDINPPTIVTPKGDGQVSEVIGNKVVTFDVNVSQAPIVGESEVFIDDDNEAESIEYDEYLLEKEAQSRRLPKDPLALMFEGVREAELMQGETFIAQILRRQDFMNDNFNNPCQVDSQMPPLQFTSRDIFNFVPTLQKNNNNSGGRFTIAVYRQDGTPVTRLIGRNRAQVEIDLGIAMLAIPNPTKEQIAETAQVNNNGSSTTEMLMLKMFQKMEENQTALQIKMLEMQLAAVSGSNGNREPSEIERTLLALAMDRLTNPPKNGFEESIGSLVAAPMFASKMIEKMFPEPQAPHEPTTMETITGVLETPLVQNAASGLFSVFENLSAAKKATAEKAAAEAGVYDDLEYEADEPEITQRPEPKALTQDDISMQDLIEKIVVELSGINPLNAKNKMIQELSTEYSTQWALLKSVCGVMAFEGVLEQLTAKVANLQPNPFVPFLNIEETQKHNMYIWNEQGLILVERLKEFYEYVKVAK